MHSNLSLTLRTARLSDIAICGALDASYSTEHSWQLMQERAQTHSSAVVVLTLRVVRLPRARSVLPPEPTAQLEAEWGDTDLFLVAEIDHVVGYSCVTVLRDTAWLTRIVVDTPHRRTGIASSLLTATRQWARENGFSCVLAAAPAKNYPAVSLLRANGYKICGYNERHYSTGEVALYLALDLPDA